MASSKTASKTAKTDSKSPKAEPESPKAKPKQQTWESRAVSRLIEAGSVAECPFCGERVKFRARHRDRQIICNIYDDGVWQRVEQYHEQCYEDAGNPYGESVKA